MLGTRAWRHAECRRASSLASSALLNPRILSFYQRGVRRLIEAAGQAIRKLVPRWRCNAESVESRTAICNALCLSSFRRKAPFDRRTQTAAAYVQKTLSISSDCPSVDIIIQPDITRQQSRAAIYTAFSLYSFRCKALFSRPVHADGGGIPLGERSRYRRTVPPSASWSSHMSAAGNLDIIGCWERTVRG